ncbi:MAG: hypothetical protein ABIM88_06480 [candidate division WOR-3 bacterium]
MGVLRDTLSRIDAVLGRIEEQALEGDARAGALYSRLMAQRAEIALKIRDLERGADRLLEWLLGLLKCGD